MPKVIFDEDAPLFEKIKKSIKKQQQSEYKKGKKKDKPFKREGR